MWKSIDKFEEENAMPEFVREKFTSIDSALKILNNN